MADNIKTVTLAPAEQMREAAAQLADLLSGSLIDQHNEAKEYGVFGHGYLRSASDDVLRLAAAIRALPLPPAPKLAEALDVPEVKALVEAVNRLGLRAIVAGWNGEGLEKPYQPHPAHLWATIKTTCGVVYEIDAALARITGEGGEC